MLYSLGFTSLLVPGSLGLKCSVPYGSCFCKVSSFACKLCVGRLVRFLHLYFNGSVCRHFQYMASQKWIKKVLEKSSNKTSQQIFNNCRYSTPHGVLKLSSQLAILKTIADCYTSTRDSQNCHIGYFICFIIIVIIVFIFIIIIIIIIVIIDIFVNIIIIIFVIIVN